MSRTCTRIARTMSATAGLILGALATSTAAAADPAPANPVPADPAPALPGLVDQVVGASGSFPQQLLQSTNSTLTGAPVSGPQTGIPIVGTSAGSPNLPGLPGPGELAGVLQLLEAAPTMGSPVSALSGLASPTLPIPGAVPVLP